MRSLCQFQLVCLAGGLVEFVVCVLNMRPLVSFGWSASAMFIW